MAVFAVRGGRSSAVGSVIPYASRSHTAWLYLSLQELVRRCSAAGEARALGVVQREGLQRKLVGGICLAFRLLQVGARRLEARESCWAMCSFSFFFHVQAL